MTERYIGESMFKKICIFLAVAVIIVIICMFMKITKIDKKRLNDIEYKVLSEEEIPIEILEEIEKYKQESVQCSYICSAKLYIVVTYGRQDTSGYTVEVNDLYESSNAIFVKTTLKGPATLKEAKEEITYPYIVLSISLSDKKVVFI